MLSLLIIALLFVGVLTKGLWQSTSKDPAGLIEKTSEDDPKGGLENSELQAIKNDFKVQGEVILAVEDNLVKGAAGQAVQNMNLMFGLPETLGLTSVPVLP